MSIPAGNEPPYSGLVTTEELKRYMSGLNLNANQDIAAAEVLIGVQNDLENYLNRSVQLVQVREAIQTDGLGYANVSKSPVVKIISKSPLQYEHELFMPEFLPYNPASMERDSIIGDEGRLIDRTANGVVGDPHVVPGAIYVGTPNAWFVVEYIGGLDCSTKPEVKLAIMRVAAREVSRNHDDTISLREGNAEQAAETDTREKGWTEAELKRFDRLRRRVVV